LRERSRLVDELLRDGIHVALPVGARDIDLLAYVDVGAANCPIASVPIKIASSGLTDLSCDLDESSPGLLIAFTPATSGQSVRTLAFTRAELVFVRMIGLMRRMNLAGSSEGARQDDASNASLDGVLQSFTMSPGKWRRKILSILEEAQRPDAAEAARKHIPN
jgi:hypothetical protein